MGLAEALFLAVFAEGDRFAAFLAVFFVEVEAFFLGAAICLRAAFFLGHGNHTLRLGRGNSLQW
jgi:hypothetical protein